MTYNDLVDAIRNYTEVDSNVFSTAVINTFITMAENKILRDIDHEVFKKDARAYMTTGNRFLASPADLLTHRYMYILLESGDWKPLQFRDVTFEKEYWPDYTETGEPKYYGVFDDECFYIAPTPDQDYITQLGYIYRPAQLSSTNTESWFSKKAPEALLYACLVQAYSYTKGPLEMLQFFENSYQQAMQGINIEQSRRRRDEYRDGMIRIPIKSENPGPIIGTPGR